ncbi:MAG: septum site-determining protein MinC [Limnochordales bacterium]|nr:septum site-determining protein MinC [Limnochordales bacterium]
MNRPKVVFKGTRDGLLLRLDGSVPFGELLSQLRQRLQMSANFYQGGQVRVEWGGRQVLESERRELERVMAEHGLVLADSATPGPVSDGGAREKAQSPAGTELVPNGPAAGETRPDPARTLYVRRTLRSGQRLRYDGHVVIMGDVHPGAEVVAAGDVVVLGRLQGVVHAGSNGDRRAVVVALVFEPMQLRIAELISRAPDDASPPRGPEQAEIRGEQIVVRPLLD